MEVLITTTQTLGTGDTSTGETTEGMRGDTGAISGKHEPLTSIGGEHCSVKLFVIQVLVGFEKKNSPLDCCFVVKLGCLFPDPMLE